MKIKRWMMTALLGVMAVFAVSANPMGWNGSAIQNNDTLKSVKDDLLNAGKAALRQVKAMISLTPEQEAIHAARQDSLLFAGESRTSLFVESPPGTLPTTAGLPQPIRKICGVLIHADQNSINTILRTREYRGSG